MVAEPKLSAVPRADAQAELARIRELFELQRSHRWTLARTTAAQRIAKLKRLREKIAAEREALAEAIYQDFHKPRAEVELTELHPTLEELQHTVRHLARWMRPQRVGTPLLLSGTSSRIRFEPKGQVVILAPWNYPFQLLIAPLIGAIAAGNAVILKPSEKTPHTAAFLEKLIRQTFDPHEVALVTGGVEVAEALLELPFDHFFFTGGPLIGQKVMLAAARHHASVTLELGGKSPAIVDADANIAQAAERLVWGKFINAGQTCIAPDYVLVHASRERELLDALKREIARAYGPSEEARLASPDFARLVDDAALRRLKDLVDRSVAQGARLECGGGTEPSQRYLAPTLLSDVKPAMPVMESELFGPVLPVLRFTTREEAYTLINQGTKPLALYAFTRSDRTAEEILAHTTAGGTVINNVLIHLANPNLPFGGVGVSGLGNYHGLHGFKTFSHERAVVNQWAPSLVTPLFPPYGRGGLQKLFMRVVRWFE